MDLTAFVPNVRFEQIPIKNLVSCQVYQRNLSQNHVRKAAANFDLHQINPVKVSRRDGINYVFNGQHTIEIVALVSGSRETPVWCMIYDDREYTAEADIFANQMKFVKPLMPYEIFVANVEAGNDEQLIIKELVESFGLKVTSSAYPGGICAVSSLEFIYEKYGYANLQRTLMLAVGTWEGESQSLSGGVLKGISRLISIYGDDLNDDNFKERLSRVSIREVVRTAKERRGGPLGFVETFLIHYNKKTRFPLLWEKLYDKKQNKRNKEEEPAEELEENEQEYTDEFDETDEE